MRHRSIFIQLSMVWLCAGQVLAQQSSFFLQGSASAHYAQFPFGSFNGDFNAVGAIDTSTFEPTDLQGVGGILLPDSVGTETLFWAGVVVNPDSTLDALGMYLTAPNGFEVGSGSSQGINGVLFYLYHADSLAIPTNIDSVDIASIIGLISAQHKFTGVPTGLEITERSDTRMALTFGALAIDLDNNTFLISVSNGDAVLEGLTVAVDESPGTRPLTHRLESVYPNPFNPRALVRLDLAREESLSLVLYNLNGQAVRLLHRGVLGAGPHELPLVADGLASGIYLLSLESPDWRETRRITLLR